MTLGPGPVEGRIAKLLVGGPIHFTLIDPEKSPGAEAAKVAKAAVALGSHAILLGGSTGISPEGMGRTARAVKATVDVPVVIFPEGPGSLSPAADAVLFMSLLNSRSLDLVIRAHARVALAIRAMGLEAIPMGYLVIAPGMRVGEVGQADVVPREDGAGAAGYSLAAQLLGMRFVYLEAGSGAPSPVPAAMVGSVVQAVDIPVIVGGGIRSGRDAAPLIAAGARILVTGSVAEEEGFGAGYRSVLEEVLRARR